MFFVCPARAPVKPEETDPPTRLLDVIGPARPPGGGVLEPDLGKNLAMSPPLGEGILTAAGGAGETIPAPPTGVTVALSELLPNASLRS